MGKRKKGRMLLLALAAAMLFGSCSLDLPFGSSSQGAAPGAGSGEKPGTLSEILMGLQGESSMGEALSQAGDASGYGEPSAVYDEMKAVWIAYLDLAPILKGKTETEFSMGFDQMVKNCQDSGLNTLIIQVRPFGDSFYPSKFFSWSECVGGELSYDPMKIMTQKAREAGLSIHAWINPMRAMTEEEVQRVALSYPIRQWYDEKSLREENLIVYDKRIYLNPASEAALKLIADGAAELMENYQVDGIHIDDYFYPPSLPLAVDASSYASYVSAGGTLGQEDWRRENTFRMAKELSKAVKDADPQAQFGVSPRGQMAQNYDDLYIDLEKWVKEDENLSYLAPQLYYGFRNQAAPFTETAAKWDLLTAPTKVKLIVGLAAYKIGSQDAYAGDGKTEWVEDPALLAGQIEESRKLKSYGGVMLFRYGSIFTPQGEQKAPMEEARKTFIPLLTDNGNEGTP